DIAVVGGGDSAMEEALFLARMAESVTVIHRRDELRASKIMAERALNHPKISFMWNTVVEDLVGEDALEALEVRDVVTDTTSTVPMAGLFVAIGHRPNTDLFLGQLAADEAGYLITAPDGSQTSAEGVFACGDVQDETYRQAIT
ncbi:MAG: FAD-dependent oxidoreductase, partial [Microthrixaceae bacterium]|nr:FAD-dependent oxidoreductase [Microthrixaceae bacterium]